ncbi:MAG: hypothetical protein EA408_12140 [Marinilabiliales bacterium]|nr:MAG: hypothetical protein EA408_12140 [Marinilabiliales bacterium]
MDQKDYLLREIEKIGMIMSAIRQKLFGGGKDNLSITIQQQRVDLKGMLLHNANLDFDRLMDLDAKGSDEYLSELKGFSVQNIELLAETISDIGHKSDSTTLLEKALQLFEICNLRDRTFSIERENNISKIKSTLQHL